MTRQLRNKRGDSSGTIPKPKNARDALRLILGVVRDKRGHVLKDEHYDWIDLKIRIIGVLARRGLRHSVGKPGE